MGNFSSSEKEDNKYDVIVIGSGIGGLTAASVLARYNKKRVLVLEKHFVIGGLTHTFSRKLFNWEVGIHYVGNMFKGSLHRMIFDFISKGGIKWKKINNPFERFIYPGFSIGVSGNKKEYIKNLIEKFPDSKKEIKKYFRDINRAAIWFKIYYLMNTLPPYISPVLKIINSFSSKLALMKTGDYMNKNITDPSLKAVLSTQWGNYGAPPDESAFVIHATIVDHYLKGGYFPEKAPNNIASTIKKVIESENGKILVNREVSEIIIENNRAAGVKALRKKMNSVDEEVYYAPIIISNTGAEHTYRNFLPENKQHSVKKKTEKLKPGYSAVSLYAGMKDNPKKLGVHGENIWINETLSHNNLQTQTRDMLKGKPHRCYVSFPSIRGKDDEHEHTVVIIAIVDYDFFEKWKDQAWLKRANKYYELKKTISGGLINLVDKHVPGFKDMTAYMELSTPLTMEHFTNKNKGAMYSYRPTRKLFERNMFKTKTPLKGLFLCGTDLCSVGITGAMMGGIASASSVNGHFGLFKIIRAIRKEQKGK